MHKPFLKRVESLPIDREKMCPSAFFIDDQLSIFEHFYMLVNGGKGEISHGSQLTDRMGLETQSVNNFAPVLIAKRFKNFVEVFGRGIHNS